MVIRELDGIFIRVDGKARCLTDLPWSEVVAWLTKRGDINNAQYILSIAEHFHDRLRKMGDQFDIIRRDDNHELL